MKKLYLISLILLSISITCHAQRKGEKYIVSPFRLIVNEGNYYLLAFDDHFQQMRTYRIDRMKDVKVIREPRDGAEAFAEIDLSTYTKRVFSMYGGENKHVSIRFISSLLGVVIERFGTGSDGFYRPDDQG